MLVNSVCLLCNIFLVFFFCSKEFIVTYKTARLKGKLHGSGIFQHKIEMGFFFLHYFADVVAMCHHDLWPGIWTCVVVASSMNKSN